MEKPSSVFVTYILTTPDKLWEALTNSGSTEQSFLGQRMESDWTVGSTWKLLMEDGRIDSQGTVLESDPPRRLCISWRVEWVEEYRNLPESKLTFQIDPLGEVVRLTVSEFHHPSIDEKHIEGGRRGWPVVLSSLKSLLETGRPLPPFKLPEMPTE
jgi:uncharacterized protein YndB with AHSA1/START domain